MSRGIVSITAKHFFDGANLHDDVVLSIDEDGILLDVSEHHSEHEFFLVSVGLVDIQMNGYGEHDVAALGPDSLRALDSQLRSLGTVTWLGTLVTAPLAQLSERVDSLTALMSTEADNSRATGCAGIHLEGPFLGSAIGAHAKEHVVSAKPDWIAGLPSSVRMMTVAAENSMFTEAARALRTRNIVVSLGHTRATRAEYDAAVAAGATSITHLFNAMSGVHHRDGGIASWALVDDRLTKGLIGDGVHMSDDAGILAGRAIPADKRYLVSDSIAWNGRWAANRGIVRAEGAPRLPDGTLAGSAACLAECVKTAVHRWRWPLVEALRSASLVPARLVNVTPPSAVVGQPVFLVGWTADLDVTGTFGS